MSAFVHHTDHIDVCVTALRECRYTRFEGQPLRDWSPSDLGRRLLATNIESVLWRYQDSMKDDERGHYESALNDYEFAAPAGLHCLSPTRRLVTFLTALSSLDYQSCELPNWEAHPVAQLIRDARADLTHQLAALHTHPDAWSFSPYRATTAASLVDLRRDYEHATEATRAGQTLAASVAYLAALVRSHPPISRRCRCSSPPRGI